MKKEKPRHHTANSRSQVRRVSRAQGGKSRGGRRGRPSQRKKKKNLRDVESRQPTRHKMEKMKGTPTVWPFMHIKKRSDRPAREERAAGRAKTNEPPVFQKLPLKRKNGGRKLRNTQRAKRMTITTASRCGKNPTARPNWPARREGKNRGVRQRGARRKKSARSALQVKTESRAVRVLVNKNGGKK